MLLPICTVKSKPDASIHLLLHVHEKLTRRMCAGVVVWREEGLEEDVDLGGSTISDNAVEKDLE